MPYQNKNIVLLELISANLKLVISMDIQEAKSMTLFSFATITVISGQGKQIINNDEIFYMIEQLYKQLTLCLKQPLLLHESIQNSIGFYQNTYYQDSQDPKLIHETLPNGYRRWVGYRYMLFDAISGRGIPASWLYNNQNGDTVLEISQIYPWDSPESLHYENFIPYQAWIKTFAPDVVISIQKETIETWVKQLELFMQDIQRNDKLFRCTGLGCNLCVKKGKSGCPCGSSLK